MSVSGPDDLTFMITDGDSDGVFAISEIGEITVSDSGILDYETVRTYTLTVEISDGSDTVTAIITVNVEDADEGTLILDDQILSVNENSGDGAVVGSLVVIASSPSSLTYLITGGNTDGIFTVDENAGLIRIGDGSRLDHETTPSHALTVEVTDGVNTASATITVNVNDVDEAVLTATDQTFPIREGNDPGTLVGTVTASSPNDTLTYQITGGNTDGVFTIHGETGEITVSGELDYETTPTHTLTVEISDGTGAITVTVTVNVTDVAEVVLSVGDQTFPVAKSSPAGTVVGSVRAVGAGTLAYAITDGNAGDVFTMNGRTGEITVSGELDYETTPSWSLTVEVSDGTESATATITVTLTDVDEETLVVGDQTFLVEENRGPGTSVGMVFASTPEGSLTFGITGGNIGNAFSIDRLNGELTVGEGGPLDYETLPLYLLTVEVSDGRNTRTASVTVSVTDVDEVRPNEPPSVRDATFSVDENSPNETAVGTVTADDPDGDALTYRITGGNTNAAFALNRENGDMAVNDGSELDYETTPAYTLAVEVSDGTETASATVTINIADVNEATLTVGDQTFPVDENSPEGTSVGTVAAKAPTRPPRWSIASQTATSVTRSQSTAGPGRSPSVTAAGSTTRRSPPTR